MSKTMARTTAERLILIRARSTSTLVSSSSVASFTSTTMRRSKSATRPGIGASARQALNLAPLAMAAQH